MKCKRASVMVERHMNKRNNKHTRLRLHQFEWKLHEHVFFAWLWMNVNVTVSYKLFICICLFLFFQMNQQLCSGRVIVFDRSHREMVLPLSKHALMVSKIGLCRKNFHFTGSLFSSSWRCMLSKICRKDIQLDHR